MTIPSPSEAALHPLTSDLDVLERVRVLLGRGYRRQLWFMFLDADDRQLPLLMPSDIPRTPGKRDARVLASFIAELVDTVDAASIVVTLERPGRDELTESDRVWLRLVRDATHLAGVPLRGPMIAHTSGVRWIAGEDLTE